MTERGIWEERLWTSNAPLPRRELTTEHPMYGLPRQYVADDQVLTPWGFHALAPVPSEWEPLPNDHEAVYLVRNGKLRIALVDYGEGTVVAWRRTAGSAPYAVRQPHAGEADEPAPDPLSKPRRARNGQRRTGPTSTTTRSSRKPTS